MPSGYRVVPARSSELSITCLNGSYLERRNERESVVVRWEKWFKSELSKSVSNGSDTYIKWVPCRIYPCGTERSLMPLPLPSLSLCVWSTCFSQLFFLLRCFSQLFMNILFFVTRWMSNLLLRTWGRSTTKLHMGGANPKNTDHHTKHSRSWPDQTLTFHVEEMRKYH